jgi:hypothetical protein
MNGRRRFFAIAVVAAVTTIITVPDVEAASALTIRQRLARCYSAVNRLYVGPVKTGSSQVPILSRKVHRLYTTSCTADNRVLGTRAGKALFDLYLGLSYYQQYLTNVRYGKQIRILIRQAQSYVALGKHEARSVLG